MSTNVPEPGERRRKPALVRSQALEAGRRLLLEEGPRAVTLKAVGAQLGMSHANLIHHFGSAEAFQAQLADSMLQSLTRTLTGLVERHARGEIDLAAIVDTVFEAYRDGGIGRLLAWSALTGGDRVTAGLAPELEALVAVVEQLVQGPDARRRAGEMVRLVAGLAFADSLIGPSLSDMLGDGPDAMRREALKLLGKLGDG